MRHVVHIGIMFVISALIFVAILFAVGFEKTAWALADAGPEALVGVGVLSIAALVLRAAVWQVLNRPINHQVGRWTLFKAVVVGMAGNIITPCAFVGGEPLKIVYLSQKKKLPFHEVAGTVLLSKYLEAVSFILFFGFSTVVATLSYRDAMFVRYPVVGVTILVFAGAMLVLCGAMALSLRQRWHPLTYLAGWLARVPFLRRRLSAVPDRARTMEDQVSRVFCEEGAAVWAAFGLSLLVHVTILLKLALFFNLVSHTEIPLRLGELCFLFIVTQVLLALQLMPSAMGTLDGGLIGAFALMGYGGEVSVATCMAFLIYVRFWDAVVVGAGAVFAARAGTRLLSPKPSPLIEPQSSDSGIER